MQPTDFNRFCELFEILGERFGKQMTPNLLKFDFAVFEKFPLQQIEQAVMVWYQTGKFFPKPVELIELIQGVPVDRAEKAWDLFVESVRRGGSWKSIYAADSAFIAAISRCYGGWSKACELLPTPEEPMFAAQKKAFLASYNGAKVDHGNQHYLAGILESANRNAPKLLPDGQTTFSMQILCVTDRVSFREMEFDAITGRLTEQSSRLLTNVQPLRLAA